MTGDVMSENIVYKLVDTAYDRWEANKTWSKTKFWNQLSQVEKVAVFANSLEYQVLNGGFRQWIDNRYCTKTSMAVLKDTCFTINTPCSLRVLTMLETIENKKPYYHFDDEFPKISPQFLNEVGQYISEVTNANGI